jgi:hypothetical protein
VYNKFQTASVQNRRAQTEWLDDDNVNAVLHATFLQASLMPLNAAVQWLMLQLHILEVWGFKSWSGASYPDSGFL